ncbi:hypothetical protein ACRAWB_16065 [Leifsonia poae]|uniref:hypothetical protein n=1 Tax=Leifsonia poae TaxID=110933 RepID=UPI003D687443
MSVEEWETIRRSSVHNPLSREVTLGKWEGPDNPNSYTNRAAAAGERYFDLGADWDKIKQRHGLTDGDMFDLFNRPFLDDAIKDSKLVRFTHDPQGDRGALGKELEYLEDHGYIYDPKTKTARN